MRRTVKFVVLVTGLVLIAGGIVYWQGQPPPRTNVLTAEQGQSRVMVMDFSSPFSADPLPPGWYHRTFWTRAPADFSTSEKNGVAAMRATTNDSASMLVLWVDIDLQQFPVLRWRWYIEKPIESELSELTREGDDHPARLFIAFQSDTAGRRAMEIIWANEVLDEGDYKYIDGFPHYVAGGGDEEIGRWYDEEVNLLDIYREIWPDGGSPRVSEIALFSDSDETDTSSIAYYADVSFSDN